MIEKKRLYKGLQFKPVWFEDTSLTSPSYFNITEFPTRLTAGINIFKIKLNRNEFSLNSNIDIEVLDITGEPIYAEVLDYIDGDTSAVVAIHIRRGKTLVGQCSITLIGEAKNVPEEWVGRLNVKWSRIVTLNPYENNTTDIIFTKIPELEITEQVGVDLDRIYDNTQFPIYSSGNIKYYSLNKQPVIEIINGKFNSNMVNSVVTVETPINATPIPTFPYSTSKFTSTIKKVLSDSIALLDAEYTYFNTSSLLSHTYDSFEYSAYTIDYEDTPNYIATQNSESYAIIEIKELTPEAGNVSRIKLYANNAGTIGTWEPINDIRCTAPELFTTDTTSVQSNDPIGLFRNQNYIDTYWEGITYITGSIASPPTLLWHTASLMDAIQIQNQAEITSSNSVSIVKIKSEYQTKFLKDYDYKLIIDAISENTTNIDSVLSLYMSGSSFIENIDDTLSPILPINLGKKIGELRTNSNYIRYDDIEFNFTANYSGSGVLLLVVENGDWKVSNIRTTPDFDFGYTPNYTKIRTIVPTSHKSNNQLSFKAEYYNIAGVRSKQVSYAYNKNWVGGNRYIDGDYSMLTGSLYVADSLNSGIAISGYANTGYVRSLGYNGFHSGDPGFLIWSGSAMPGSAGTKGGVPYSGVGLEMYANSNNYFRYSTSDSELDIRTDKIYIGNSSTFISASNGNLQISSSNFSINANGDVTASNIDIRGVSRANIIQNKSVTITAANSSSYLRQIAKVGNPDPNVFGGYVPSYYVLCLDGSLGGEIVQRVLIACACKYQTDYAEVVWPATGSGAPIYTYPIAIAGIEFPSINDGQSASAIVEVSGSGVAFRDDFGGFGSFVSMQFGGNELFE